MTVLADCSFCKIAAGEIPASPVYQDDTVVAFRDISPQAPGHMLSVAAEIARQEGIEASGYRLVFNVGPHAGESVPHLHLHLLGGRQMAWPPG